MKLLVVMPSKYIGNMVIAMQSLAATLNHHRGDDVSLLVDETFKDLVALSFGDRCSLLVYPRRAVGSTGIVRRTRRYLQFVGTLRSTAFDRAIDFDGTVVSARLMRMARAKEKTGPGFAKRQGVYQRLIPMDKDAQHCFDDFRLMAEAIGVLLSDLQYFKPPAVPDTFWDDAATLLPLTADDRAPVVCIHPSATKDYKQWDIEKFAALADRMLDAGWRVVLVGAGETERDRISTMLAGMKGSPVNLHGRLDLLQLLYLFQHARLFIGNDSGPMHLASAAGTEVIALFGPTELLRWQPRAPGTHVVKGLEPCSPACRPEACLHDYRCLRSLTVDQVQDAIDKCVAE